MKVLIIDNYDSFTYNLVHLVEQVTNKDVTVWFNDQFDVEDVNNFEHIILSPGPALPKDSGKTLEVIEHYKATKNILGVCLGHQAIGEAFGGSLKNLPTVFHGIETEIFCNNNLHIKNQLFHNISNKKIVGRYHSWVIDKDTLPTDFYITSTDEFGNIMAIQHKQLKVFGVQFHPESIMTNCGKQIIKNWLSIV